MQIVELHYQRCAKYDRSAVVARAQEILGAEIGSSASKEGSEALLIIHKDYPVEYSNGTIPAQTAILDTDRPTQLDAYQQDIQQSWRCPNAGELLGGCTNARLVTEMMARLLPAKDRLRLFHGVLRAMIEITSPNAMVFKHTQQVIKPSDYLASCDRDPILRSGSLNVRFFNISDSGGDMLMDTRGLHELELHDLQCHYRGLDAQQVASVLFNTGVYILENGPVIESGQTVEGITPGSKWRCQFEDALLEPKREVLDLDPGDPYAAGNRDR